MSPTRLISLGFFAVALFACSGSSDATDPVGDEPSEEELSAGRAQLKGSWVRVESESGGFGAQAYYFSPDGTFFRDNQSVLLGVAVPPAHAQHQWRDEGRYTVNTKKHTVTLRIMADGPDTVETLEYEYTPALVALGMPVQGGHMPHQPAKLQLHPKSTPTTRIAASNFQLADSYCTGDADCVKERKDKTWEPDGRGSSTCAKPIESRGAGVCETK